MRGPVWHASGRGRTRRSSERIATFAIRHLGEGEVKVFDGNSGIVHAQRHLSAQEREEYGVGCLEDVRGKAEGERRERLALSELPPTTALLLVRSGVATAAGAGPVAPGRGSR
jgi:hypothetical protein